MNVSQIPLLNVTISQATAEPFTRLLIAHSAMDSRHINGGCMNVLLLERLLRVYKKWQMSVLCFAFHLSPTLRLLFCAE